MQTDARTRSHLTAALPATTIKPSTRVAARASRSVLAPRPAKATSHAVRRAELPKSVRGAYTLKSYNDSATKGRVLFHGVHHVALLVEDLQRSLDFYCGTLGLEVNPARPDAKLPYRGTWLWIGPEMIHLMELPNPDPVEGRPEHGGRDRHFCIGVHDIAPLEACLKDAGVEYTRSMSGRPAIFFRDPDSNCLECVELEAWR